MSTQRWIAIAVTLGLAVQNLTGCATLGRSMGVGGATGGLLGAGIGAITDPGRRGENRFRNTLIGTGVGAVVGVVLGFAMDHFVRGEREGAVKEAKEGSARNAEPHSSIPSGLDPKLVPARTEARWVPDQVRGSIFVPGHFEFFIVEGAKWER